MHEPHELSSEPVQAKWKEVVDIIMEEKVDIGYDKLLRRGVKRMSECDSRPEAVLKEELRNVLDLGALLGYSVNADGKRVKKDDPILVKVPQRQVHVREEQQKRNNQTGPHQRNNTNNAGDAPGTSDDARRERPQTGSVTWRESLKRVNVKAGKFSNEEEVTLRTGVLDYAKKHGLPTDDFSWIIGKKEYSGNAIRGIWTEVAKSLPHRTIKSVAAAGVRMFHPYANKGAWSSDEDASLHAMVGSLGTKWTKISETIERTPEACRLRWREIRSKEAKSGTWGSDEEKLLTEAVEKYGHPRSLKGNSTIPKTDAEGNIIVPNRRMILDDINWEAVVAHVKTRSRIQCVTKWYLRLSPTMQDRGEWDRPDDKILLKSLWNEREKRTDVMEHQIQWDTLVPGRSADQCKRRWALMRKAVKGQKDFEFSALILQLVKMLSPRILEESNRDE